MKKTKPTKVELKLTKQTVHVPDDQLPQVNGGAIARCTFLRSGCLPHTC